jgi:hypothetical protein
MNIPDRTNYPAHVTVIRRDAEGVKRADVWTVPAEDIHKLYMLLGEPDDATELPDR